MLIMKRLERMMSDGNIVDISTKFTKDKLMENLKKSLNSKAILIVSVREDGESFDSFVDDSITDIDFCYAIDCLMKRRELLNKERNS